MPAVEPAWQVAVRAAFADHSQRYGSRRLRGKCRPTATPWVVGAAAAYSKRTACGPNSPARLRERTTDSDPAVSPAPTRLLGQPAPTAPNRGWVGDITYLPRQGSGWLYLAGWLDRYSKQSHRLGRA